MIGTVGSNHFEWTALFDGSVETDDKVVSDHFKASLFVPAVDILYREVFAFDSGRTVDDDFPNTSGSSFAPRTIKRACCLSVWRRFSYLSHSLRSLRMKRMMGLATITLTITITKKKQSLDALSNQVSGRVISLISVTVTS